MQGMTNALSRGQYSDAVLSELESQNDEQVEGMSARVKMLKDVWANTHFAASPHLISYVANIWNSSL